MELFKKQAAELEEKGYLAAANIADPSDVRTIRSIVERLFAGKAGLKEGAFFDMLAAAGDRTPAPVTLLQIANPTDYAPALAETAFFRDAKEIARQILGPEAKLAFEMVILKPAFTDTVTPWHQDEAFRDPRFEYKEITLWMPLQDTSVENGCMNFIPRSHKGPVLAHRSPGGDPTVHALECCGDFDSGGAIACPLRAGGCTIHFGRTLHHAGANRSNQPRYAYILGFRLPPRASKEDRRFPWLAEKRTTDSLAKRRWMLRGGILVMARRTWRRGGFSSLNGLRYGLQRSFRLLFK